jgi:Cadherin-like
MAAPITSSDVPFRFHSVQELSCLAYVTVITMTTILLTSSSSSSVIEGDYRKFYVIEDVPSSTVVCNLVTELGLESKYDPAVVERLRFSFLTHPPFDRPYFSVDEKTGIIRTTRRIDREKLCPGASSRNGGSLPSSGTSSGSSSSVNNGGLGTECLAQFDVAIKPIEFFQIVKIAVEIVDVNDHAPEFPTSHTHHRIAESADPESTGIVIQAAVDQDAGRNGVRMYQLQSPTDKFLLDMRETADGGTDLRLLLREPLDRELEDR